MNHLINPRYFHYITTVLAFIVCGKMISLMLVFVLPKEGVDVADTPQQNLTYRSYKLSHAFGLEVQNPSRQSASHLRSQRFLPSENLTLHGLYHDETQGFIIVSEISAPSVTTLVALKENYKGYTFTRVEANSAILENAGKEYRLAFDNTLATSTQGVSRTQTQETRAVRKEEVMRVSKNFDAIWKDIAIKEVVKEGNIEGFKVLSLNNSSLFGTLGLLPGDVIVAVNNQPIRSYADAFEIYNNIGEFESIKLDILRQNTPKELEYEIY